MIISEELEVAHTNKGKNPNFSSKFRGLSNAAGGLENQLWEALSPCEADSDI